MNKERVSNIQKVARVGLAAGAAFGGALALRAETSRAQTPPNLAPNPSFETNVDSDPTLPDGWVKTDTVDTNNLDTYNTGQTEGNGSHTGTASVSEEIKCINSGTAPVTNNWSTDSNPDNFIALPDASKPLDEKAWVKFISSNAPQVGDNAVFTTYFTDINKNLVGTPVTKSLPLDNTSWNNWEQISTTLEPGTDIPSDAKFFKIVLLQDTSVGMCTNPNTVVSTLIYDDIEITDPDSNPPSVGGIAEVVDPKTLPVISAKGSDSKDLDVLIAGAVVGTLAVGAAGVKIRSIRRGKVE